MRLLTGTNTPLLSAMAMVRQMISFYPIEASLILAEKDILLGSTLSATLAKHDFYFFEQLANRYTEEVEYKTNAISGLLEPLIIIS